jgi:diguanylate cyclase (GGDEF)-like protein/PAS domain S-box-containing protein
MDAVLAGKPVEFDIESSGGGRSRHMHTRYVPQLDEDGVVQGFYALSTDISALRISEARIRAITDNLPALIAYVDTEERLRFCNRYFHELPGVAAGDPVGKRLVDIYGPIAHAALLPFVMAALAGQRMAFEHALGEGDARRVLQLEYLPDRDGNGRILGFYSLATDITSQKKVETELQHLARFDGLTGLPNRGQLRDRLAQALERGDRSGRRIAVMVLDIDHFKQINDSLGHEAGDRVLKEFARRLSGCVRATDLVARLAGDEFVILLEGLHDAAEVRLVANKIIDAMQTPFAIGDVLRPVSTSIGIAVRGPAEPADPDILLRHADESLYAAKRAGRNTWEMQPA